LTTRHASYFQKNANGSYSPVTDLYHNSVAKQIGARDVCPVPTNDTERAQAAVAGLMEKYAEFALLNAARKQGHQVEKVFTDKQGNRQIVLQVA